MIRALFLVLILSTSSISSIAQPPAQPPAQSPAVDAYIKANEIENIARQAPGSRNANDLTNLLPERRSNDFLHYLEAKSYKGLLDSIDAARLNKFVAAPGGSGGSTALLSKVAVPAVLGLGVEYGSILRQSEGTSTTLRGNLLGLGQWALGAQQFPYCPEIAQSSCSTTSQWLRRLSGSTTFEDIRVKDETVSVETSTGNRGVEDLFGQDFRMAAWGLRFDLTRNQLDDPRYVVKWREQIAKLRGNQTAAQLTAMVTAVFTAAPSAEYTEWRADTIAGLQAAAGANEMKTVLERQLDLVVPILERMNPTVSNDLRNLRRAYSNYFLVRDELLREAQIHKLSLEYANNHPRNQPSQSSIRLIYSHQPARTPAVITVNFAMTMYNTLPAGTASRLRDVQLAGQMDRPLGDIAGFGQASLALAGYYQWMKEDALLSIGPGNVAPGSEITLPGEAEKLLGTKGSIFVVQGRLTFPMGDILKVPISVTWANRTELIKENDVRGQVGITLDMDSLFRK